MPADLTPPPFQFPLRSPSWPVRDVDVGIAFPKGGMHGTFHAGVVHAFVLSGYLPAQAGGSSMGAYAAATLAIASELDDQAARLRLVGELIAIWRSHPGRYYYSLAWKDPKLLRLLSDGGKIPMSVHTLARAGWELYQGTPLRKALAAARLWIGLFPNTGSGWRARGYVTLAGLRGALDLLLGRNGAMAYRLAQAMLDAYGMRESILPIDPGDAGFNALFERWMPERNGRRARVDDLTRTRLTLQLTNLRWAREATLGKAPNRKNPVLVVRDGQNADLVRAIQASASLQPMHAPHAARHVFPTGLPPGVRPDDPLVDSSHIAHMPVDRLIDRWRDDPDTDRTRSKRIFTVFSDPLEGAPPTDTGFFAAGVHDLYQLAQRDQLHDIQITRLLTELVRAAPGVDPSVLVIDPTPIVPATMLGFQQVSVPEDARLEAALSHGCRAAMQVLHRETLLVMATGGTPVSCPALRARLRAESNAPEGYFAPVDALCQLCSQELVVQQENRSASPTPLRDVDRLDRLVGAPPPPSAPPLVVVPAGGAFLGVFHIGVLVALREHGVSPDIYAGASVGTMFSMLMHSGLQQGKAMDPRLVERMFDVDTWADHDDGSPKGPGRVDRTLALLIERLNLQEVRPFLGLSVGRIVDVLLERAAGEADPSLPYRQSDRERLDQGVAALFFGPAVGPRGTELRALSASEAGEQAEVALRALIAGDVPGMLRVADRVARHYGIYEEGYEHDGEFVGFDETSRLLHSFAFPPDRVPTLAEHAGQSAHFLFTVTNHTTGRLEFFGGAPGEDDLDAAGLGSPHAIQAVLAGSSLPLAFRRRSRAEVFERPETEGDVRYTDGGIYNNFPVDAAIKYLRFLSQYPEYRWLADRDVRFLLLPLEFPPPPTRGAVRQLEGCLRGAELSWKQAELQKLRRVLTQQQKVHRLAPKANAALAEQSDGPLGLRLAIRSDFDVVAPARRTYPSSFAFKRWLGFSPDKQAELLGAGCRRTRYALLFREWREARESASHPAPLAAFDTEIRAEVAQARRRRKGQGCVLGNFNQRPCAFLEVDAATGQRVRTACFATARDDLPPEDLPATSRVDAWTRLTRGTQTD